jgi:hypothetical protein
MEDTDDMEAVGQQAGVGEPVPHGGAVGTVKVNEDDTETFSRPRRRQR